MLWHGCNRECTRELPGKVPLLQTACQLQRRICFVKDVTTSPKAHPMTCEAFHISLAVAS